MLLFLAQSSSGSVLWSILLILGVAVLIWLLGLWLFPNQQLEVLLGPGLSDLPGLDSRLAAKLQQFGIRSDRDLVAITPRGQQELESQLGLHDGQYSRWKQAILDRWRQKYVAKELRDDPNIYADPDLGGVYSKRPQRVDNLASLNGISGLMESRLNSAGIYTFEQLRLMTPQQRQGFKHKFNLGSETIGLWEMADRVRADRVTQSAAGTAIDSSATNGPSRPSDKPAKTAEPEALSASTATRTATGSVDSNQPEGALATSTTPSVTSSAKRRANGHDGAAAAIATTLETPQDLDRAEADDLTRLVGIDQSMASKLNSAGISTFRQLQEMSPSQLVVMRQRFGLPSIDVAEWRRCLYAWGRGIETTCDAPRVYDVGQLHGIQLPKIVPGVFDGERLVAYPEQVVFRGSNAGHWGTEVNVPRDDVARSLPLESIRSDINYVRLRRTDTRQSIVVPITKGQLFGHGNPDSNGWNGLCESFFGGKHLGVFANDIPQEVETRFGQGGWGFGHRFDHNDQQECGWAGRLIAPTAFEISVGHIGAREGTVVFRSIDPTIWNTRTRRDAMHTSDPIANVSHPFHYLRMMRIDTGEAVIVSIDECALLRNGDEEHLGWNGLNEFFSGGHHLGIYCADLPQMVETRFGCGGWGFGHPYGKNNRQAYAWAGQEIAPTAFEILLLEHVPNYLRHELLS